MSDHPRTALSRPRRRLLQAMTGAAAWATSGAPPVRAMPPERTAALLEARLAEEGVGLAALQVDRVGASIAVRGSAGGGIPLADDACWEIGSITKLFTALLLAGAVVEKRLGLFDPVEAALPFGVALRDVANAPIRWIDLATHRSGLPRLPGNFAPRDLGDPFADYDETLLLRFLRDFRPTRARDAHWEYSNLGFGLLGWALGRAAGSSYPQLLAQRVLAPLGMSRSALALPGRAAPGLAAGHDALKRPVPHWRFGALAGAGGLVMPIGDLARFAAAALAPDSTPLGEAFRLSQRGHAAGPSDRQAMGLGWMRTPLGLRRVLGHDGDTGGFSSSLRLDAGRGRAAAVLANARVEIDDLALHLLDESVPVRDFGLLRRANVLLQAEQLAPLVGVYAARPAFRLSIVLREGQLWAEPTGQEAMALFATSPRRFFARVAPLEIEFAEGAPPRSLALLQGGLKVRFVRE